MAELSYRKFCSLTVVALLLLSGITVIGISGARAEQTTATLDSFIVYGEIRDKFGALVDTAIVVAINENTGNATWVYAENGTYSLDLANINGSVNIGDTIEMVSSNGICISNKTFVVEGNSSMRIDFVLDPEEPVPPNINDPFNPEELASPEIDNPFNPEELSSPEIDNPFNPGHNSSSPEMMMPEFKPDLIITELSFSDDGPVQGDVVTLTATVTTTGMYTGVDIYSGPNQDQLGSDGIGDTSYYISGDSNKDDYPLMNPDPNAGCC